MQGQPQGDCPDGNMSVFSFFGSCGYFFKTASKIAIRRHVKIRSRATPFDPKFLTCFKNRQAGRKPAGFFINDGML
ncbi:group II intron reverse transcriptase/maturase [Desulfonema ishimotonii]|uniref:Group II intron reverse transcriptase/maturase n=1 Tax=Desulfonema ishimotonii TaxID=45657 RepID=A0A401FWS8_9BACT|nr:group II intron reverse transcriptase/maturase [Desulfonema ishimotonii]